MWHRQIDWIAPIEAAARLARLPGLCLLDSAMTHPTLGRYSVLAADPFGLFQVRAGVAFWDGMADVRSPLDALRARLADCAMETNPDLPPFQGGAIGSLSYDLGWSLEGRSPPDASMGDDGYLAFHDVVVAFDYRSERCWIIASGLPERASGTREARARLRLDWMAALLDRPAPPGPSDSAHVVWSQTITRDVYRRQVERVQDYIRAGDIYQANIAQRFVASLPDGSHPFDLYRSLRAANPAPFAAYLDQGARHVLSTSPELFLRARAGHVETRPIKGTARREDDHDHDRRARSALLASAKDRAENVMIVDLLRNDLSRVCEPASVETPVICELESYAGLHHLVSVVTGQMRDDRDALDLVAASFPGGSITGAPKLRAMEIIAELERRPRGIYCGAIGMIGFDGAIDLSIAIRTIVIEGREMELQVGGGITILSDPDREYEETLTKAHRLFGAFAPMLAETDA